MTEFHNSYFAISSKHTRAICQSGERKQRCYFRSLISIREQLGNRWPADLHIQCRNASDRGAFEKRELYIEKHNTN